MQGNSHFMIDVFVSFVPFISFSLILKALDADVKRKSILFSLAFEHNVVADIAFTHALLGFLRPIGSVRLVF